MKKYLSVCFALLFAALNAQDCNQILLGEVIDFHDGTPLFGATVTVAGTDITAVTDFNGKFTLEGLCNGTIEVRIEHPDCVILTSKVTIEGNTYQKFTMEHHMEELGEVVVTESRIQKNTKTAQEQLIKRETIERYSGQSLGDALKEISGVSSLNTGSTIVKPVIQGLHSSRVIIMNSGVRMQDQEWGSEHAPNLDLNSATSLSVIKGAAALKYGGDAIGGIIIAEPQKIAIKDTLFGSTLLTGATNGRGGTLSSSLVKGYKSGWNWKLQGTLKRLGDFEAPDYTLSNTGVFEKGLSSSFGYNSLKYGFDAYYSYYENEIGILRASHIGNVADLIRALNSDRPLVIRDFTYDILAPKQKVAHHLARIKAYKRVAGVGKWNLQYDFQHNNRLEFDIRRGEDNKNRPSLDLTLTTHTLNTDFVYDARPDLRLNAGFRGMYQTNFPDPATGVKRLIPDYDRFDAGVFMTGDYRIGDQWLAEAGVRYDLTRIDAQKFYDLDTWQEEGYDQKYPEFEEGIFGTEILVNPVLEYHNFSATGGIRFTGDANEWLLNYALASRAPNPSELFSDGLHHSAAAIEIGALDITSEVSHKVTASFSKTAGNLNLNIAPYFNLINGFILLEPSGLEETIRGAFPVWKYRQTDAYMIGIDIDASYQYSTRWRSTHKFAYVYGEDLDRNVALIDIPAANLMNRISFSMQEFHELQINATSQLVFEQTNYPDNRFEYPTFENGVLVNTTVDLSTPPPACHLLGVDASVKFDLSETSAIQVAVIGSNLLNTRYRDYLNRQRFFADDLGRNIQLQLKLNY
ncbi:TonB-dependent receptor domain-containing protein [Robertkochia sediminum]|uniref:TonB-dependent receptor domain-containing protein n=1 Tax=Robertkochia sediminum TaxID=2785326 RepID=UPI0019312BCF|nr:TonB-dependent receptor [Robertkochia sediminum]MBL7473224.1 TonB-dependent receptor [Robertkochia sediminum]